MSQRILSLFLVLSLISCGRNVPQATPVKQSTPQPTNNPTPTNPTTSPAPSAFKWTEQQLSENTEACAEAGTTDFSYAAWKSFCRCAYEAAARRWTFDDFQNNFEARYDVLYNDGVINQCLDKAGISLN